MITSTFSLRFALGLSLAALAAQGCLYPKPVGNDRDASASDAASDGGVRCIGDDGRERLPGESFPSSDGCNTCACDAMGRIACTARACAPDASAPPADAGDSGSARTCARQSDCGAGEMCVGPEGCGVQWTCVAAQGCTADFAPFCSCRGVTVHGSSSCPPEPYVSRGACPSASDAGPAPDGNSDGCMRTGCSGQLCASEPQGSTCEFLPEYACYNTARCERQGNGSCGWTPTASLTACIDAARRGGM
jgi:hypothetical protein